MQSISSVGKEPKLNHLAIASMTALLALMTDGCRLSSSIFTQERIVVDGEKTDFGFTGTWKEVSNLHERERDTSEGFSITMNSDGVYTLDAKAGEDFKITLRATSLSKDSEYAIVDVDIEADKKLYSRYLAIATRKDDELFVWWIESKNIAKMLHESGHSAVVEHGTFSTRVYVKPDALLDCVREHSKQLVGEPMRLKQVSK